MNWIEYVRVLEAFRARHGRMPSSMLTEDGALDQIKAALDEPAADVSHHPAHGIRRRRDLGH